MKRNRNEYQRAYMRAYRVRKKTEKTASDLPQVSQVKPIHPLAQEVSDLLEGYTGGEEMVKRVIRQLRFERRQYGIGKRQG